MSLKNVLILNSNTKGVNTMKPYILKFEKYYTDKSSLPTYAGIYLVYKGKYNGIISEPTPIKLLYIGESDNIKLRHQNHEHEADFINTLKDGEILIYSTVLEEDEEDRKRIENALVFHHKPPINDKGKDSFGYNTTCVISSGACDLLDNYFVV